MVEPAAVVASAPMVTGATSMLPEPMNTPSSITVRVLFTAVVVAGDGAGSHVDVGTHGGIAEICQMIALDPAPMLLFFTSTKFPTCAPAANAVPDATLQTGRSRSPLPQWHYPARCWMHHRAGTQAHVSQHAVGSDAHAVTQLHLSFEHRVHVDEHIATPRSARHAGQSAMDQPASPRRAATRRRVACAVRLRAAPIATCH